jgi:hypothetical protein
MERKRPPSWLFAVLALPYGVLVNGLVGTVLSYLLRQEGIPVDRIANEVALLGLPTMLYFLWSPLTDFWMRRKNWLMLSAGVSGAALFGAFRVRSFADPLAVVLLLLAVSVAMLTSACSGGLMGAVVGEDQKTRVSSFYQAGSLSGGALGGGGLLVLAQHWSRPAVGAVATALMIVPAMAAKVVDEPEMERHAGGAVARLRAMVVEFRATFLRWESVPALLLLVAPMGSGAAIGLLPSLAPDYGVSAGQVAWINGLAGGLLTLLPKRVDARIGYPVAGLVNALCLLVLCVGQPRPGTYMVGAGFYMFTIGAAYALFTALVLQVMGDAGKSGGSRYAMLVSLGNAPVSYMAWADGRGYKWFGPKGLPGMDLVLSGVVAVAFLLWFGLRRREVAVMS